MPPFCKHANEVLAHTSDLYGGSSTELVRIILQDLGLTSRILRVANSALYNRSGHPIMSVAHGTILLGWDNVRNLVSTVRYLEHFAGRAPGLRELLLLSLLSAVHGRNIAATIGYPCPEDAYICGLFRNRLSSNRLRGFIRNPGNGRNVTHDYARGTNCAAVHVQHY